MLDIASPATLDQYHALFVELCRRYPKAWHLCAQADIRCRGEFLLEERRRQEAFHTRMPQLSAYDPLAPWNSVLKVAGADSEFWDRGLRSYTPWAIVGSS